MIDMRGPKGNKTKRWSAPGGGGLCFRLLALLFAGWSLATAAAADDSDRQGQLVFQFHWYPQAQFAGYLVAQEKGFYRDAGLGDLEILSWSSGDPPVRRLLAGEIDFATAWAADAVVDGEGRVVCICQILQESALLLVTRADSGIVEPRNIGGRKVGMWGGSFDVQLWAFYRKYGVQPQVVKKSYSIAPFLRGAVDVTAAMYYNEYHRMLEAGLRPEELRVFRMDEYGFNFPEDGIYCTREMLARAPDLCRAFVAATLKGWDYAVRHEAEALDIVMSCCDRARMATNRNHQRWMLRAMAELIRYRVGDDVRNWGILDRGDYEAMKRVLEAQGLIESAPDYAEFFSPPAAEPEGGR